MYPLPAHRSHGCPGGSGSAEVSCPSRTPATAAVVPTTMVVSAERSGGAPAASGAANAGGGCGALWERCRFCIGVVDGTCRCMCVGVGEVEVEGVGVWMMWGGDMEADRAERREEEEEEGHRVGRVGGDTVGTQQAQGDILRGDSVASCMSVRVYVWVVIAEAVFRRLQVVG